MDEAAREARRLRILANSEKRLHKILGVSTSPTSSDQNDTESEINYVSPNLMEESQSQHSQCKTDSPQPSLTRYRGNAEQVKQSTVPSSEQVLPTNLPDTTFGDLNTKQAKKEDSESYLHSILAFLAITTITMLNSGLGSIIGNSAIVPFLGFELYRFYLKKEYQSQPGGLFNTALLLSGIPQDKLSLGLKIKDVALNEITNHNYLV